jgi:hypothetical protein
VFSVKDPMPLADPPATVNYAGAGGVSIQVKTAGRVLIRVPYSPWLSIVDEQGKKVKPPQETEESEAREDGPKTYLNLNGCLLKAEEDAEGDEWTELLAPEPGVYHLAAPYGLVRGTPCPDELR